MSSTAAAGVADNLDEINEEDLPFFTLTREAKIRVSDAHRISYTMGYTRALMDLAQGGDPDKLHAECLAVDEVKRQAILVEVNEVRAWRAS